MGISREDIMREKARLRQMESGVVETPWWAEPLLTAIETVPGKIQEFHKYEDRKLTDQFESLQGLLSLIDNPEGMQLFDNKLKSYSQDSSTYGDHSVNAQILQVARDRKNQQITNFGNASQEASDFISSDQFLDTQSEFVNIQDTIDAKNKLLKADGKRLHGSVSEFLYSEIANADRLLDDITPGLKIQQGNVIGSNYRYNKSEVSSQESYRQLKLYRERLDLATKSLAGDGLITSDEAFAILSGDEQFYNTTRNKALSKAEDLYKKNDRNVKDWAKLIDNARNKQIESLQEGMMGMQVDDNTKGSILESATSGDWQAAINKLTLEQGEYKRLRNEANNQYKNWYGGFYESLEGGLTEDEINSLLRKDKGEVDLTDITSKEDIHKVAEKVMDIDYKFTGDKEEAKKEKVLKDKGIEPPPEDRDKELYSYSENILIDYIKGDADASAIKQAGGQSLLNKANRIKDAYKGEYAGRKLYKGKPVSDIETLKELKYGRVQDRYSWYDVVNSLYGKKEKGTPLADQYLMGEHEVSSANLPWTWRRKNAVRLKKKFMDSNMSLEIYKKKRKKDYDALVNVLSKSR
jgi:hypothetical protein